MSHGPFLFWLLAVLVFGIIAAAVTYTILRFKVKGDASVIFLWLLWGAALAIIAATLLLYDFGA